jgi:general secretion pathway protein G
MSRNPRRNAFTLIEVLIVVIIMAVLAATIIPQFASSTKDAQTSSLNFSIHSMRSQVEMYKIQHLGNYPALTKFVDQMTKPTNISGGTTGDTPYGPYVTDEIPTNPFKDSNTLVAVATAGEKPTAIVAGTAGWQYDESNGAFWPNNPEAYP